MRYMNREEMARHRACGTLPDYVQKTWRDLLGLWSPDCVAEGCYIVRCLTHGQRRILYRADDAVGAKQILSIWKEQ